MLMVTPSNSSEIRHVNESPSPNPSNYAKRAVLRGVVLWFFLADHRGEFEYN